MLAGYLVNRLTGEPYSRAVQKRVLTPLRMSRTTFQPTVAMTYPFSFGHVGNTGEMANRSSHLMKTMEKALETALPLTPKPEEPEPLKFTEIERNSEAPPFGACSRLTHPTQEM